MDSTYIFNKIDEVSITDKNKDKLFEIIKIFIMCYNPLDFNILESNGQSFVLISEGVADVVQYYINFDRYNRVISAYGCGEKANINIALYDMFDRFDNKPVIIDYSCLDYLPKMIYHCSHVDKYSYVVWEKLTTLNSFEPDKLKSFIIKNFKKLLWDITKALEYFHRHAFLHGDPSLDNIGINSQGNFVLYDFDASISTNHLYENSYVDYKKFFKSIAYHLDDKTYENYLSEREYSPKIMFEKLSKFSQDEINVLNNTKIIF